MATTHNDHKKVKDLQKALETQLLALEKLGALPTPAADEIRNIVAEGIADKFGETYRTFPSAREGTEIRRDAVPKPCALRKSVEGFVAEARTHEKTAKSKGQEAQKKVVVQAITSKERATFNALAHVREPQRNLSSTVGQAARHEKKKAPRKTGSPQKQLPKASSNPSNPTKDGPSKNWPQTDLESGRSAWDAFLAQKAAEIQKPVRPGNQQNPTQGTGSTVAPVTQQANAGPRKDGPAATAGTLENGEAAHKAAATSLPCAAAVGTSGEAPDHRATTGESAKPKSSPPGKANSSASEDLIEFNF